MSELTISKMKARQLWIQAQKLDQKEPFGAGSAAVMAAVEHLGYVQIDTISVVERCHHHILFNRIPRYKRQDLLAAQSHDKTVFEYWTHALSYVPTKDFRFFLPAMKRAQKSPGAWFRDVKSQDVQKVLRLLKKEGPISIRDIEDDVLVEKNHPWASRKPSKKALQMSFHAGQVVIAERVGMLKKYDLIDRHFGWTKKPKPASEKEILGYLFERALRSQGLVSLDSICYMDNKRKAAMKLLIDLRVKADQLLPMKVKNIESSQFWIRPEDIDAGTVPDAEYVHILSPFDPLIIQRKRLKSLFDYDHKFEAYLPKEKRIFGYFALPVLLDGVIVAALDLKTDRQKGKLLIQQWNWVGKHKSLVYKKRIEAELHRFEKFQLSN